jgi:hypothetical protein
MTWECLQIISPALRIQILSALAKQYKPRTLNLKINEEVSDSPKHGTCLLQQTGNIVNIYPCYLENEGGKIASISNW